MKQKSMNCCITYYIVRLQEPSAKGSWALPTAPLCACEAENVFTEHTRWYENEKAGPHCMAGGVAPLFLDPVCG